MFEPAQPVQARVEEALSQIENLSVEELKREMESGRAQVIDIRDIRELQKLGRIPGALHIPRGMLEFWVDPTSPYFQGKVDPEKRMVLYCRGGARSALATKALQDMGFPDVAHLETGFTGWTEAGEEVEKTEGD